MNPAVYTTEQLDDYLFCPAYYAYRHIYGIEAGLDTPPKLYAKVMSQVLLAGTTARVSDPEVSSQILVQLWEKTWTEVADERGLTPITKGGYLAKGISVIRSYWSGLDTPVLVSHPVQIEVGDSPVAVVLDVVDRVFIRPGAVKIRASLLRPSVARMVGPGTRTGITRRVIKSYGRDHFGENVSFRTYDYTLGKWTVSRHATSMEEGLEEYVSKVIKSIETGLFFPKAQSDDCSTCPYNVFCDAKYTVDSRLSSPKRTQEEISKVLIEKNLIKKVDDA